MHPNAHVHAHTGPRLHAAARGGTWRHRLLLQDAWAKHILKGRVARQIYECLQLVCRGAKAEHVRAGDGLRARVYARMCEGGGCLRVHMADGLDARVHAEVCLLCVQGFKQYIHRGSSKVVGATGGLCAMPSTVI